MCKTFSKDGDILLRNNYKKKTNIRFFLIYKNSYGDIMMSCV